MKHFVNLTNGIEAIPRLSADYAFIRIQSTACEQKRWDFVLQDLDNNFLMSLALGDECVVHDFSANKNMSRACYQGVEWVRYAVTRNWIRKSVPAYVRGHNAEGYFAETYAHLDRRTISKINYFRHFINTDSVRLTCECATTEHDGDYLFYREQLTGKQEALTV